MDSKRKTAVAEKIMRDFAHATGLSGEKAPRRYLWTDAFAVCNFLGLYRQTGNEVYRDLAFRLVNQVHHVLGQHREDDPRQGWLSGLSEEVGSKHPTSGGLRIGKRLPERQPGQPLDRRLEWERDGQYYHYLTKWMVALDRATQVSGDLLYNRWARELAKKAHAAFVHRAGPGSPGRIYWKLSIDLSRPLVPSMGHHDPLDGYITYSQLQVTAAQHDEPPPEPRLDEEIDELAQMCAGKSWTTDDPLGLGGLLTNAYQATMIRAETPFIGERLPASLLENALPGLESYVNQDPLNLPAGRRLAFRELGLSIGLHAVELLHQTRRAEGQQSDGAKELETRVESLLNFLPVAEKIEAFWLEQAHQEIDSWVAHRDINQVMLATSLAPQGYLAE